jgi:hypothetical protein
MCLEKRGIQGGLVQVHVLHNLIQGGLVQVYALRSLIQGVRVDAQIFPTHMQNRCKNAV